MRVREIACLAATAATLSGCIVTPNTYKAARSNFVPCSAIPTTLEQTFNVTPGDGGSTTLGGNSIQVPASAVTANTTFIFRVYRSAYRVIEIQAVGHDTYTFPEGAQPTLRISTAGCTLLTDRLWVIRIGRDGFRLTPLNTTVLRDGEVEVRLPGLSLFMLASPM